MYSGGRSGTSLNPLESAFRSLPGQELLGARAAGGLKGALTWPIATWVTAVALMAPLVGLAFARLDLRSPGRDRALLLGLLLAAVGAFFALDLAGFSQLYFLWFGFTAAALVSAGGLVDAARARPGRAALAALAAGVALGVVLGLGAPVEDRPLLWAYMAVAALAAALAAVFALGPARGRLPSWPAVLAVSALLTAAAIDAPADRLPDLASRALNGEPMHTQADPQRRRGVTRELAEGLAWVRDHTGEGAVLAVNNHVSRTSDNESRFFYYSALAERRVFVESWEYTDAVLAVGIPAARAGRHPFAARAALNDRVYSGEGASAATELRRRGVTYVLVDRVNAPPPRNRIPGRVVFRNGALVVYRL
jgi:MFS family permease